MTEEQEPDPIDELRTYSEHALTAKPALTHTKEVAKLTLDALRELEAWRDTDREWQSVLRSKDGGVEVHSMPAATVRDALDHVDEFDEYGGEADHRSNAWQCVAQWRLATEGDWNDYA